MAVLGNLRLRIKLPNGRTSLPIAPSHRSTRLQPPEPEEDSSDEESSEEEEIEAEASTDDEESPSSEDEDDGSANGNGNGDANNNNNNNNNNNMANNANPPALPMPNQGNPFAPAPGAPGKVLCPLCPLAKNAFLPGSMGMHFQRKHTIQEHVHYFGALPRARIPCPLQCGKSFIRQSDTHDHVSEIHNRVPTEWRTSFNKQRRRQLRFLIPDYVGEAATLNALMTRITAAEANQPGHYVSVHGLPLVPFETDPDRVPTNQAATVPIKVRDVATKLVTLRKTTDQMGQLLGGGVGTWDQVANELEANMEG